MYINDVSKPKYNFVDDILIHQLLEENCVPFLCVYIRSSCFRDKMVFLNNCGYHYYGLPHAKTNVCYFIGIMSLNVK